MSEVKRTESKGEIRDSFDVPPLAYFLTFSAYGTHLPGSEKGWVDIRHRIPGSRMLPRDAGREAHWQSRLKETPFILDSDARVVVLNAIRGVCIHRQWNAYAIHVRSTHVHAVVEGGVTPERMLTDFKAYSTRALRNASLGTGRGRYWTEHGSTRYLWNQVSVEAAVTYVLEGQGMRMACYTNRDSA